MKRQPSKSDQLILFPSPEHLNNINKGEVKEVESNRMVGKQVFLNSREEVYNRILNRKME